MLLADLAVKSSNDIYANYQVDFGNESHVVINIDYNAFESFTFNFVNVRDTKDIYRVDLNYSSHYIFNEHDYQSVLSLILNSFNK